MDHAKINKNMSQHKTSSANKVYEKAKDAVVDVVSFLDPVTGSGAEVAPFLNGSGFFVE